MSKAELRHDDCRNFIPIDVAKGFCNAKKMNVMIDTPVCGKFEALPKCKNCANFKDATEDNMGKCVGFDDGYWAFADLKAANCEKYEAK